MNKLLQTFALACLSLFVCSGCNYLKYSRVQAEYRELQRADPSQRNLNHLIDRQNFGVIGQITDPAGVVPADAPIAVAAFSSRFKPHELVVANRLVRIDGHFGLDLPPGDYDIIAFADLNRNAEFDRVEAVSHTRLALNKQNHPSMIVPAHIVELEAPFAIDWDVTLPAPVQTERAESLFFPVGALRSLDDPIFSKDMAVLGQYDPAEFLESFPTVFYALEEDLGHKLPIIFVHGISGSPREFQWLVDQIDRTRFKPWFYYYPSGEDLGQMGKLFYDVFLSGQTVSIDRSVPMVIVAHSMGGLVVREALNVRAEQMGPKAPIVFVSLASPFGGHPSARMAAAGGGLVLPSWRDLNPDNAFVSDVYRQPLSDDIQHHLFFAYDNGSPDDLENGSDGVVPLSSQLHAPARQQAISEQGFAASHSGILETPDVAQALADILTMVRMEAPPNHAAYVLKGGFEVEPAADYTPTEAYLLLHYGHYLGALASGELEPANDWQKALVPMLRGDAPATNPSATAWLKYAAGQAPAAESD